ncbi:STAS domain-containing protein [Arsenicicoccus piscis]|uniref:Anti-sigma factor antagonist n=1 Tax=Arsenicicoccus piscis TaxID=673954 RepID=A0ABQ6HHQ8_9MICO|nr:STAS domain-containing protein [Arsenicicoccus piscis]GMA18091.1 anti-sigma F factor antagonist [Arsenicicoccus piscis]GMA22094.1 anti-sigma F factor antagonist [Arsenicicoccus piscis]
MKLQITTADHEHLAVLAVTGEIDIATSTQLRQAIDEVVRAGAIDVVLDLRQVTFMDSSGLSVVVGRLKMLRRVDGRLSVVGADAKIRRIFEVTGLDQVVPLYDTVEEVPELGATGQPLRPELGEMPA